MSKTYYQIPDWSVRIQRMDYTQSTYTQLAVKEWTDINNKPTKECRFVSNKDKKTGDNSYTDLIEYEFENKLSDMNGAFRLTLTLAQDKNGLYWSDKIKNNDIVFIDEFGKNRFIGIVVTKTYTMSMNQGKPQRSILISGFSVGGKLQSYNVPMNVYLWKSAGSLLKVANDELMEALALSYGKDQSLEGVFNLIKEKFLAVNFQGSKTGFKAFIDKFLGAISVPSLKFEYPITLRPFTQDSNTLLELYRQVVPAPIYELYGVYKDGIYVITARECPFDQNAWDALKKNTLNPLFLLNQNLSQSSSQVFTHFYADLPVSVFSKNDSWAQTDFDEISATNAEKMSIYGYNLLEASMPFVSQSDYNIDDQRTSLKKLARKLYAWYNNNDEFYSGSITQKTVPDKNGEFPQIGERLIYLSGASNSIEFYIEADKHSMKYPAGGMQTTLTVTRGYEYGKGTIKVDGETLNTPQIKEIERMGSKIIKGEQAVENNRI